MWRQGLRSRSPADHRVVALVSGAFEEPEEDESSRHGCVQDAQKDQGRDHEREGKLQVQLVAQRSESRSGVVLSPSVGINNGTNQAEDYDLCNGNGPQSLGEILGLLHLGNETGNGDLTNECIADVQESVHAADEGGTRGCHNKDLGFTDERT